MNIESRIEGGIRFSVFSASGNEPDDTHSEKKYQKNIEIQRETGIFYSMEIQNERESVIPC